MLMGGGDGFHMPDRPAALMFLRMLYPVVGAHEVGAASAAMLDELERLGPDDRRAVLHELLATCAALDEMTRSSGGIVSPAVAAGEVGMAEPELLHRITAEASCEAGCQPLLDELASMTSRPSLTGALAFVHRSYQLLAAGPLPPRRPRSSTASRSRCGCRGGAG